MQHKTLFDFQNLGTIVLLNHQSEIRSPIQREDTQARTRWTIWTQAEQAIHILSLSFSFF